MTTLQLNCLAEYTLAAMDSGTYSLAVVPVLQGGRACDPNAKLSIDVRLVGNVKPERLEHLINELLPIVIKDVGNDTDRRPKHPKKVLLLSAEIEVGSATVVKPLHPKKTPSPIDRIVVGIGTDVTDDT